MPHSFRVYTRSQIVAGNVQEDHVSRDMGNGFLGKRSGDIFPVPDPYYYIDDAKEHNATSHQTPFNYDTHVPIIFMGSIIKPGKYNPPAAPYYIAPTLHSTL